MDLYYYIAYKITYLTVVLIVERKLIFYKFWKVSQVGFQANVSNWEHHMQDYIR